MRKSQKVGGNRQNAPGSAAEPRVVSTALKWIGGLTAVLSLIAGLHQLQSFVSESRERHRQLEELLKTAKTQEQARDFRGAWSTLKDASRLPRSARDVQAAQAELAMHWLETRLGPDQRRFDTSEIAPALERASSSTQGQRKADLLAHAGWAQFLRFDDDSGEPQARLYYRQALQIDPSNVYAHAMRGYWALWSVSGPRSNSQDTTANVEHARKEFALALSSGRQCGYVRRLQLNGFGQLETNGGCLEVVRALDEMMKSGEQLSPEDRKAMWDFFNDHLSPQIRLGLDNARVAVIVDSEKRQPLLRALAAVDQLRLFHWLFDGAGFPPSLTWTREYYRAVLQEAAGQRAEASQTLVKARSAMTGDDEPAMEAFLERESRRLSQRP